MTDKTQEVDVNQTYVSAMHSVDLINRMYDENLTVDEDDLDTIRRNKEHLEIMLGKDFWTEDQDLTPLQEAIDRTE